MHTLIHPHFGRVLHAVYHPDLARVRPTFAFVPEEFFDGDGFRRHAYLCSRWPCINTRANPHAVGSHVMPDPARPVAIRSRCPNLAHFLQQLTEIIAYKATCPRRKS